MESKTVIVGLIIGIVIGGSLGYFMAPSPDVSEYESQKSQLQSQVDILQNEVDDLQEQLDDAPLQDDFDKLEEQVNELQSQVESLNAEINSKESTINSLQNQISTKDELIDEQVEILLEKTTLINELQSQIEAGLSDDILIDISFSRIDDTSALLMDWMDRANESLQIMVMLITRDELADALIEAHNRGIDVDVIIDDDWYFSSGSDYQRVLDSGVDIRGNDRSGLMHHKVMIVDGYVVITGSHNWSDSAEDNNDENIIVLSSTGIADIYLVEFDRLWSQTTPLIENGGPEEPEEPEGNGHVVINEVEANPAGTDTGNEWVELYNPTDQTVNIGGWKLFTTRGDTVTRTISEGTTIAPGQYIMYTYTSQWIDNENESIILKNALNQIVDETPILSDTANSGSTWARSPNGIDTDSPSDWDYQSGTKGAPNY